MANETATRNRGPGGRLLSLVLLPVLAYAALLTLMFFRQESLLFHPLPLDPAHRFTLPGVHERRIAVPGAELHALHFRQPGAKGVVFFLHGNAGNVATWLTDTAFYRRTGFDLLLLDYRGYGKSGGRIDSEAQLHADVRAAWDAIAPEYEGRLRVFYGRSLGTGLAARLAVDVPADLLVLVSPYSSVADLASELYPWVPTRLLRYPLRTDEWLPRARAPVLIVHGSDDDIIPFAHAQRLHRLRPDAALLRIDGYGHNDLHLAPTYGQRLERQLAAIAAPPAGAAR
jgi:pimeloyl-ACP methyl ester carboxylesterase